MKRPVVHSSRNVRLATANDDNTHRFDGSTNELQVKTRQRERTGEMARSHPTTSDCRLKVFHFGQVARPVPALPFQPHGSSPQRRKP